MTEAEWLDCTDPQRMLESLRWEVSDRRLRLVAVACARRGWDAIPDGYCRQALEVVERFADNAASGADLRQARDRAEKDSEALLSDSNEQWAYSREIYAANAVLTQTNDGEPAADWVHGVLTCGVHVAAGRGNAKRQEQAAQAELIRCVVGNPFRPVALVPAWLTWHAGTIPKLAQAIYEDRDLPSGHLDNTLLAILADALEDASCTDQDVLNHCRGEGPHVRGCWVVDLLLGQG
jgi:hypothetical protein